MTVKLTVYVIVGDSASVGGWTETFGTERQRDERFTEIIEDLLAQEGRNLTDFEGEDEACQWLDDLEGVDRPTTEEHVLEFPEIAGADVKLWQLIAACQKISSMAPKPEVPELDDPRVDGEQLESVAYDAGLYHAAEIVRAALRDIGVEPNEGTTDWYHEEPDEEAA